MKILAIEKEGRLKKMTDPEIYAKHDIVYVPTDAAEDDIIAAGKDAEIILVDAMGKVSAKIIDGISGLKMIHSDGVGFQGVDTEAAKKKGVYVCNCKGMNASAVAEQAILLMMGLLRNVRVVDRSVREGKQIQIKENYMVNGTLKELSDCTVGLYGFGDISKTVAKFVSILGAKVLYYDMFRAPENVEKECNATYVELDELCKNSDILSIHVPVTPATENVVNAKFLSNMKKGAYFINTARGELVDSNALIDALRNGTLAGAGLDCIAGEPVKSDNPIVNVEPEVADKLLLSGHIGGITHSSFKRGFGMLWDNVARIEKGEEPGNVVNHLTKNHK